MKPRFTFVTNPAIWGVASVFTAEYDEEHRQYRVFQGNEEYGAYYDSVTVQWFIEDGQWIVKEDEESEGTE
jgi:hypothetical protein